MSYWEIKLRLEATSLTSLKYFHSNFMSLCSSHPLWLTAGSSPYEVTKATIQARMVSGRYRTEQLCRFWSENRNVFCLAPSCIGQEQEEDLFHLLASCPSWHEARFLLGSFTVKYSQNVHPQVQSIALALTNPSHPSFVLY